MSTTINVAHVQIQGINVAIFDADAKTHQREDRVNLLADLAFQFRQKGMIVEKSALAYTTHGRLEFFGTQDLVQYLANNGLPRWTHTLTLN